MKKYLAEMIGTMVLVLMGCAFRETRGAHFFTSEIRRQWQSYECVKFCFR